MEGEITPRRANYWARIKQSWSKTAGWNRAMVGLTLVIAASTTIYTYYAYKQFGVMHEQLKEMKGSSAQTDRLLSLYEKQVSENAKLSTAAKQSADTASKQELASEVSQRPWVDVGNPSIEQKLTTPPVTPLVPVQPLLQNDPYQFVMRMRNYGNTPALHAYVQSNPKWVQLPPVTYVFLQNVPTQRLESCSRSAPWHHGDSALFPNETYTTPSNSQIADEEHVKSLMNAREALFWVGCVTYEDAFRRRYQTNFCFYWSFTSTPLQWNRCLTGNELIEYTDEKK